LDRRVKTVFVLFCVVGSYLPLSIFLLVTYYWYTPGIEDTQKLLSLVLAPSLFPLWGWAVSLVLSISALVVAARERTGAGYWHQGIIGLSGIALCFSLVWLSLAMFILAFPSI